MSALPEHPPLPSGWHMDLRHGKAVLSCVGAWGEAELIVHGAQLWHFCPTGDAPWLWRSTADWVAERTPRGGIPLCWPWLGLPKRHAQGPLAGPLHGVARSALWSIESIDQHAYGASVTVRMPDIDHPAVPDGVQVRACFTFGTTLRAELALRNTSNETMHHAGAWHPYLAVEDAEQLVISGLAGCDWHGPNVEVATGHDHPDGLQPVGECRTCYLSEDVYCTGGGRNWHVQREGSATLVVWNPGPDAELPDLPAGAWKEFVCLETANVDHDVRLLAPGEVHSLCMHVQNLGR